MRLASIAVIALLATAACTGGTAPAPGSGSAETSGRRSDVDLPTFAKAMEAGQVPVLVDVRTEREFAAGHVAGAKLIPLDQLQSRLGELDAHKGGPVYVICQSGGRSSRGADHLARAGFDAINVTGGTGGWARAGHPVEK